MRRRNFDVLRAFDLQAISLSNEGPSKGGLNLEHCWLED
jgi:hypothetical protein